MELYKIDNAINEAVANAIDPETGEIIDGQAYDALNGLLMAKDEKIRNILMLIKNLNADAETLKKEKEAFAARQKAAENHRDSLKRYVARFLDGRKFSCAEATASFRSSTSVEYTGDVRDLPERFLRIRDPEVNKTELAAALKAGEEIPGAALIKKQNLIIK